MIWYMILSFDLNIFTIWAEFAFPELVFSFRKDNMGPFQHKYIVLPV